MGITFPYSLAAAPERGPALFPHAAPAAIAALAAALWPATARAAQSGPWQTSEVLGWLLLALAPLAVLGVWIGHAAFRRVHRATLLGRGLDASGQAMALIDARHIYRAANDAYGRMLELPPEHIAGRSVADIWGAEHYGGVIGPNLERCFSGEKVHGQASIPVPGFSGRFLEVHYNPVLRGGRVRYAAVFLVDATRRVEAEAALRERENLYATLVEAANSVILRVTRDGRISFINAHGLRFFGYEEAEILGRRLHGLILPDTDTEGRDLRRMWENLLRDIDAYALNENENIKKNGERVWMLWSNRALRDERGELLEVLSIGQDITPLKRSRRELEGLRQALDQAGTGMAVTDLDGAIRYSNPAWRGMHGLDDDESVEGGNIGEFIDPASEGVRLAEMLGRTRDEGSVQAEMQHLRRDLGTFSALTTMTLLRDPAGNPDGLVFMAVDTSERRRLMADLDKSRQRLKVIVDNLDDVVFSLEPSGRFIYLSPAVRSMFGYEPSEVEGRHFSMLTHPDDVPLCEAALEALKRDSDAPRKLEFRGRRKDGRDIWLISGFSAIRNPSGVATQVVGLARDMTERRRMTEELQESQARFRELVKAIEEAYWLQEGDKLIYASPGFRSVFGLQEKDIVDEPRRLLDVVHAEDRAIAATLWDNRRSIWSLQDVTLRVHGADGGVRWIRARTFPVVREGLVVRTAGVAQDVTAYTRAVTDIRMAKEEAERANQVKSEFLARMGHEFRTPLNGVLGMLQLLAMSEGLSRADLQRVAEAERSGRMLLGLLDRLLEYVGLESCQVESELPFSMRDLLRGVEATFGSRAEAKGLSLEMTPGRELQDARGDGGKIRRVLDQLLDNALKFTPAGGRIRVDVRQKRLEDGRLRTRFVVDDSGPGIPEAFRETIFEPFVQADGSYTRKHGGSGLGLGIASQICACIGATLRLTESELGGAALELSIELPPC